MTWCFCIRKDHSGEFLVEWCSDGREEFILVKRDAYHYLRQIKDLFDRKHYVISYLASVLIGDLAMLKGTHVNKNRLIARLRKFLRVVDDLGFGDYYWNGVEKLEEIVRVLEAVKDEFHSVRDLIHELIYPRLRSVLEEFLRGKIKYELVETWRRRAFLIMEYEYDPINRKYRRNAYLQVEVGNRSRNVRLTDKDVEEVIRKREERQRRKDMLRYLDMHPEDMVMWYVPSLMIDIPYGGEGGR